MRVMKRSHFYTRGFTIVELLIVIVVIGILAAIIIIAFNGVSDRAKIAAVQSDVKNAAQSLEVYRIGTSTSDSYPTANDCSVAPVPGTICLKTSPTNTVVYQVDNATVPASYCVMVTEGANSFKATNTATAPVAGTCPGVLVSGVACPSNFAAVPGSVKYGTSDFCVMKYEARQANSTVPISRASGTPWGNINQTNAIAYSANVAGCTGCHLITEIEWLTIAQNAVSVASNWSSGTVGTGYLYSGHNDSSPLSVLAADTNDANGYTGTGNTTSSSQRRTLTLSNGEVIWDFAGNMYEWTNAAIAGNAQPGIPGETSYTWREWKNGSLALRGLSGSVLPGYGVAAAGGWTSAQGIGVLFSNYAETGGRAYMRSGNYTAGSYGGVFMLTLYNAPSFTDPTVGFRVTR
jgi:prepilin-type N-terminal cleavage/methylation domain-containing protein